MLIERTFMRGHLWLSTFDQRCGAGTAKVVSHTSPVFSLCCWVLALESGNYVPLFLSYLLWNLLVQCQPEKKYCRCCCCHRLILASVYCINIFLVLYMHAHTHMHTYVNVHSHKHTYRSIYMGKNIQVAIFCTMSYLWLQHKIQCGGVKAQDDCRNLENINTGY